MSVRLTERNTRRSRLRVIQGGMAKQPPTCPDWYRDEMRITWEEINRVNPQEWARQMAREREGLCVHCGKRWNEK